MLACIVFSSSRRLVQCRGACRSRDIRLAISHAAATPSRLCAVSSARKIRKVDRGGEVALKVEDVVNCTIHLRKRRAGQADFRHCSLRSSRRTACCEFSARLFPACLRAAPPSSPNTIGCLAEGAAARPSSDHRPEA